MPFSYTTVFKKPQKANRINEKLQKNKDKNLPSFTLAYHGIGDSHFDTLSKRIFDYEFSDYALRLMNPNSLEKFLNRFLNKTFTLNIRTGEFYNKYALNELYYILRNLSNRLSYKKNVEKLLLSRKK